jgi:hypothetical protein
LLAQRIANAAEQKRSELYEKSPIAVESVNSALLTVIQGRWE